MSTWQVWVSAIVIGGATSCSGQVTWGQVQSDNTLSRESSTVTSRDLLNFQVDGGATRGPNLFHSFAQFSVPTGGSIFFNNAPTIANIFSRVTGTSVSQIDGLIRANGTANLFLLNPNGILFGPNASLQIGGSFLASTASGLNFADGAQFIAIPQTAPLLTVNVPIGLQFGQHPGRVLVQGNGQGLRSFVANSPLIDTTDGLHVGSDRTLALVGGAVALEGATLKTPGGRIELGSVAGNGLVKLIPTSKGFALGYDGVPNFGDIQLSQKAAVDASGEGGGDIHVQGEHVLVTDASTIEASTLGSQPGGVLEIDARSSVEVIAGAAAAGDFSGLFAMTYPETTGAGGNLRIDTGTLLVQGGSELITNTFGQGQGGNLTVHASQGVQLIDTSADGQTRSGLFARAKGTGAAGDLTINTGTLLVRGGADASAGTSSAGDGGNLTVNATQGVQLIGTASDDSSWPSALSVQASPGSTGVAGNLTINTPTLRVQDGAEVAAGTFGQGDGGSLTVNATQGVQLIGVSADGQQSSGLFSVANSGSIGAAGNLTINTPTLRVQDGAEVTAGTLGQGDGGSLTVNATQGVQLIGVSADGQQSSGLFSVANSGSIGAAGNLTINTGSLQVRDGAAISVATYGKGNAGNLTINAKDIVLRHGSNITTDAQGRNVIGGNITINTDNLVAVPVENSDISANSQNSFGGRVSITATGIFGTQFRQQPTPLSDITASSALGPQFNGSVQINTPGIDPSRGIAALPTNPFDPARAIANSCVARRYQPKNSFIITGTTGLPLQPDDPTVEPFPTYEIPTVASARDVGQTEDVKQSTSPQNHQIAAANPSVPAQLEEAQGWVYGPHGEVILTATALPATPYPARLSPKCPVN